MQHPATALGVLLGPVLVVHFLGAPHPTAQDATTARSQAPPAIQAGRGGKPMPTPKREHVIEGTKADDVLDGREGDDWLFGREGHDVLRGGAGRDTLDGGPGDDMLSGGAGEDVLDGGAGRDILLGGDDNDFMDGGDDDDSLDGGAGNDDMDGGDGDDVLSGGAGDDALAGGDGNDVLSGGAGADRVLGQDGGDRMSGGPGDDVLEGGDGNDSLNGDDGADFLDAGAGDDVARGGAGNDTIEGNSGHDVLLGEIGNDTLLGSRGDDALDGGDDHDTLLGGDGRDVLSGGAGDDLLLGGLDADAVRAGSGNDVIILRAGDVPRDEIEGIDGGEGQDTLILNGFPHAELTETLLDPLTGGTYRLSGLEQIQRAHLFTQIGGSDTAPASFVFINPSSTQASTAQVLFFDSEGAVLARPIAGGPSTALGAGAVQPTFRFTVPPLGRVAFDASGPPQAASGAALVLADRPLSGLVHTSLPELGRVRAGEAPLLDSFVVPVLEEKATGADTGVAIFASTVASNVKLTLHRMNGEEVSTPSEGTVEIDIPANGHRIVFVRTLFPYVGGDFTGTMTVEGGIDRPQLGGPIAAVGVQRGVKADDITTFPVIPIAPVPTSPTLQFASFTAGGDSRSSITLVNPSPLNRARGNLHFFDQTGKTWAIAMNGLSAAATIPYDIAPLGSAVFTTSAGGARQAGSARAITAEGVVGALLRQTSAATGTLIAAPSAVLAGFAAPAHHNRAAGVNTHVALSSRSPLSLTLTLHDGRGAPLAGGRVELQLDANASMARTIDALFPKIDTSDFQGTLTAAADGGSVAVMVTQSGGDPGALVVMPVAALQ